MATTPKKKSSLSADDNIIFGDPDAALELEKSISRTEDEEQEAARLVHETHECLVIKKSNGTRKQTCRFSMSQRSILQLLMSQKKVGGNDSDTDVSLSVVLTDKVGFQSERLIYYNDEEEDDNDDDKSNDIEEIDDDERTESDNEDQAMDDAENNDEDKVEEEKDIDHQEQAKDDQVVVLASKTHKEKPTLFVSTSSHSVSSNYGNQFLISSPERSLLGIVKESADAKITSIVDVQIQQEIMSVLSAPLFDVLASVLRVSDLEKEVKELKHADLSTTLRALIRYEVPLVVNEYLRSNLGDAFQKEPE
ncbi:hypothetical protein Tco_1288011, partial [Tanacetum coccineum]